MTPNELKVAICDCLIAINNEDKWGPIVPPTAIDWIGDRLVAALSTSENVEEPT